MLRQQSQGSSCSSRASKVMLFWLLSTEAVDGASEHAQPSELAPPPRSSPPISAAQSLPLCHIYRHTSKPQLQQHCHVRSDGIQHTHIQPHSFRLSAAFTHHATDSHSAPPKSSHQSQHGSQLPLRRHLQLFRLRCSPTQCDHD